MPGVLKWLLSALLVAALVAGPVAGPASSSERDVVANTAKKKCKRGYRLVRKKGKRKCRKVAAPAPGVPITLTITPSSHDFGSWAAGMSSPSQIFTVTNNGPVPSKISVSIASAIPSGIFVFTGGSTCGTPVASGGTCAFGMKFTAQGSQTWSATLNALAPDAYGISGTATVSGTSF